MVKKTLENTPLLILLLAVLILSPNRSSALPPVSPEPALFQPGFREALVHEPVFDGQAYIFEAGVDHPVSVVLIHGVGDTGAKDWESLIPLLAEHYHVVAFDLPGFGRSSKQNVLYSPVRYADFVKWVVSRYVKGPFVLIGHSLGGAVALRYAAMSPEGMQRLILIDVAGILHRVTYSEQMMHMKPRQWQSKLPGSPIDTLNDIVRELLEKMDRKSITKYFDRILEDESLRKTVLKSDPQKIAGLALILEDFSEVIDQVKTPTVVIWGSDDAVAPLRTGKILAGRLPNASLVTLPQCGHVPMVQNLDRFNWIVLHIMAGGPIPKPIPPSEPQRSLTTDRIGICTREKEMEFTGNFKRIFVNNCKNVRIVDVTAESIIVSHSEVVIENSRIIGGNVSLKTDKSELVLTNVTIEGDRAIETSGSRLDLAGVTLLGKKSAVSAKNDSFLIFSVSRVESPLTSCYLHGSRWVTSGKPL